MQTNQYSALSYRDDRKLCLVITAGSKKTASDLCRRLLCRMQILPIVKKVHKVYKEE